ncbi:MAG: helix-turn-helix transcriptional regulator [Candidatus Heimdallarchaeota archaeon]|nr:MAG: helix-turn-helix transcriptional regulator [Candidatus Heimdallarchaeota archaeon]
MAEDRQQLIDHWENIPQFVFVNVSKEKYFSHPVRRDIIRLLRKGIEEESPDGSFKVRRAMNVTEISKKLCQKNETSISKTTLYFHLDILIELGLISVVATLHEGPHGRNKTKYFGRVARNLFISGNQYIYENYKAQFDEFQKFAKLTGLNLPNNYTDIPKQFSKTNEHFFRVFGEWLIKYEDLIDGNQIEMNLLYEFLQNVNCIHSDYINLLNDLSQVLKKNIPDL